MHSRSLAPLPFTYNWPDTWNPEKATSIDGDSRWQYDNIWRPFFQSLSAPAYRRPELDFNAPRRIYRATSPSSLTDQWSFDLKDDYENYGNRARFVDYITKQPFNISTGIAYIDRFVGIMSYYSLSNGIAASNNYLGIVGSALSATNLGFDDWLPWTVEIWMSQANTRENLNAGNFFGLASSSFWLATNGSILSEALVTNANHQLLFRAKSGGSAFFIQLYRKCF